MKYTYSRNVVFIVVVFIILTVLSTLSVKAEASAAASGYSSSMDYTLEEFVIVAAGSSDHQGNLMRAYIMGYQTGMLMAYEINPSQSPKCMREFTTDNVIGLLLESSADFPDTSVNYMIQQFFVYVCLD